MSERTLAQVVAEQNARQITVRAGQLQTLRMQVDFALAAIEQPGGLITAVDPAFTLRLVLTELEQLLADRPEGARMSEPEINTADVLDIHFCHQVEPGKDCCDYCHDEESDRPGYTLCPGCWPCDAAELSVAYDALAAALAAQRALVAELTGAIKALLNCTTATPTACADCKAQARAALGRVQKENRAQDGS